MFKLRFAFWTDGLPFDGRPLEQQALGGSESALWSMARELVKREHEVTVFSKCERPGTYDGVIYQDNALATFRPLAATREWDVFVAHRFYYVLNFTLRARSKWLWLHDMPVDTRDMTAHLYDADQAIVLSEFQEQAYLKEQPALSTVLWRSRNGVDLDLIKTATAGLEKRRKLLVYASRPERGLGRLLTEIWPKLHEWDPELELAISSYDMRSYDFPPELRRHYEELTTIIRNSPGVTDLGALPKKQFYRLLATAGLLVYPTSFPEISCIAALEAMACGTPVVTSADFALRETVPYGGVPGHASSTYAEDFVARVKFLLTDELQYKRWQKDGKSHVYAKYQWRQIAEEWERRAYEIFTERSKDKKKIFDQLVYESDLVAARRLLESAPWPDMSDGTYRANDPTILANLDHRDWLDGILSSHHEDPNAYAEGAGEQINDGWEDNPRFARIVEMLPEGKLRAIDVGCGAGGLLAHIHKKRPDVKLHGIDFSPALIERARTFHSKAFGGNPAELLCGDAGELGTHDYDVVISSEVLEHQVGTQDFVGTLEKLCRKGGRVILTVPSGPWEAMSFTKTAAQARNDWEKNRFHVHHLTERDLLELFGTKKDFHLEFKGGGFTDRGELVGWWFIAWTNDGSPTGAIDYKRKFLTTRPYQKLAYCMIVKNEEDNLLRNLRSVMTIADEVHITDTGSSDRTKAIVQELQAEGRYRPEIFFHEAAYGDVRPLPAKQNGEETAEHRLDRYIETNRLIAFDRARNLSIAPAIEREADWILWADADEVFKGAQNIRKYLHTRISPSLMIRQNHVTLDPKANPGVDRPFRCFRPAFAGREIRFCGIVHEQPAFSVNESPDPAFELPDVDVVHFGYLDQETVRSKCVERNLNLVRKDRFVYPARLLGRLNVMRDMIHIAGFELEKTGGTATPLAIDMLRRAAHLYLEFFTDAQGTWHSHALGFYQQALAALARLGASYDGNEIPIEVEMVTVIAPGGIPAGTKRPEPRRRWFATRKEFETHLLDEMKNIFTGFGGAYGARSEGDSSAADPVHRESLEPPGIRDSGGPVPGGDSGAQPVRGADEAGGMATGN